AAMRRDGVLAPTDLLGTDLSLWHERIPDGQAGVVTDLVGGCDIRIIMGDPDGQGLRADEAPGGGPGHQLCPGVSHPAIRADMPHEGDATGREGLDSDVHRWISHSRGMEFDRLASGDDVDAGSGRSRREPTLHRTEPRGRYAEGGGERPGERLVRFITGFERDAEDRWSAVLELLCGPLEAEAADVLLDRLADHPPEHPVEMEGREMRYPCQLLQGQGLIQV